MIVSPTAQWRFKHAHVHKIGEMKEETTRKAETNLQIDLLERQIKKHIYKEPEIQTIKISIRLQRLGHKGSTRLH